MTLTVITIQPGINKMVSASLNMGGWSDGNRVRFRKGIAEKMRGWVAQAGITFIGTCRALLPFAELAGDALLGAGTNNHLYMLRGGANYDITPVDHTATTAASGVAVTITSPVVTVTCTGAHGATVGDYFTFDAITGTARVASGLTVGGIPLTGDYVVTGIPTTLIFTFTAQQNSNSTGAAAGAATVTFYLPAGPADATPGLGWGAGGWGSSAWSTPSTVAASNLPARLWCLEAWGQTMLALPSQSRLLSWSPDASGNVTLRAAQVTNATPANGPPFRTGGMTVGMPERHAILLGVSDLGASTNYDPLLVRFSDVEDYTVFIATATNSAGSFRLQSGSYIVAWLNTTQQTLLWTDLALWSMRFVGTPYIYSFSKMDGNCGCIAQNARCEQGGSVFWMGPTAFWMFRGASPEQIPCTLQDTVFDNLNLSQVSKITCGTNTANGEIIWFYPSSSTVNGVLNTENDRYVIYNTLEGVWYGGSLARTVWIDRSTAGGPIAASPTGTLYNQETGTDDNGAAMGEYIESGYFDISDGENIIFLSGCIPDFQNFTGTVTLSLKVTDYPGKAARTIGPFTITPTTTQVSFRTRGRQAAIRIDGGAVGANWRMGKLRIDARPDGQRG